MLKAFALLLMTTLIIVSAAWYMTTVGQQKQKQQDAEEHVEAGFLKTSKDFNDKLEEFKRRRSEVLVQIERLQQRQAVVTGELKELGIKTAQDLDENTDAKRKYQTVRQYMQDVEKLKGDVGLFDDSISAIETALLDLDRRDLLENVAVNDDTYKQLRTIVNDLDDRLAKPESVQDQLETQAILDGILGSDDSK